MWAAMEVLRGKHKPMTAAETYAEIRERRLAPGLKGKTPEQTIAAQLTGSSGTFGRRRRITGRRSGRGWPPPGTRRGLFKREAARLSAGPGDTVFSMHDFAFALIGVAAGGGANLAVQLYIRGIDQRREVQTAARILYDELMEAGWIEMEAGPLGKRDIGYLHQLWRDQRTALGGLSREDWKAVEAAIFDRTRPNCIGPQPPDSHDNRLELALLVLEREASLPRTRRVYGGPGPLLCRIRYAVREAWRRAFRPQQLSADDIPF